MHYVAGELAVSIGSIFIGYTSSDTGGHTKKHPRFRTRRGSSDKIVGSISLQVTSRKGSSKSEMRGRECILTNNVLLQVGGYYLRR